jgi:ABC-type phosphate transport system substrate-binding protein
MKITQIRAAGLIVAALATMALTGCGGNADDITRVSRQSNSGTYDYFREAILGKEGKFKLGSIDQNGSKDVVELVGRTPSAIGFSGIAYATPQVKMLKVSKKKGEAAVEPTAENAKNKSYPLSRPLYLYTAGEPKPAAKAYIEWIKSQAGQDVVTKVGYVSVDPQTASTAAPTEDAKIVVAGSDTMVNLGQAWAETYGKDHKNVTIQVSGGGSGTGIAALINGTAEICNSSREMKPEEKEKVKAESGKDVMEFIVGIDALAIYVHKDNKLDTISIEEVAGIYGEEGTITKWSQLLPAESAK